MSDAPTQPSSINPHDSAPGLSPAPNDAHARVLDDLHARGLVYQCTDEKAQSKDAAERRTGALYEHLTTPRSLYNGFDPTADSLTVGNLVAIMLLRRFQTFGHTPVVLMGGATGRIGDPSGKDAERSLMDDLALERNLDGQRPIYAKFLSFDAETVNGADNAARLVNNHDWFKDMDVYTFLRDVGKHFSVNQMLQRDAVKNRIEREGQGISYTEFSYMLLQAYDFYKLYLENDVSLQTAGSDQWGNILSGIDLTRKILGVATTAAQVAHLSAEAHARAAQGDAKGATQAAAHAAALTARMAVRNGDDAFGLTAPLLTKSDGNKFGKSEKGAVWLSTTADRPTGAAGTSAYAYAQFWLNAADDDVEKFLKIFTDRPVDDDNVDALRAIAELNSTPTQSDGWSEQSNNALAQQALDCAATAPEHANQEHKQAANAWSQQSGSPHYWTIERVMAHHNEAPHARLAQKTLAADATTLLHGPDAWHNAQAAAHALFSGDVASLDAHTLAEVFAQVPATEHAKADLAGAGIGAIELLAATSLAKSNSEARTHLRAGAVSVNGEKIDESFRLTEAGLLHNELALIRRGKKNWHVTRWVS